MTEEDMDSKQNIPVSKDNSNPCVESSVANVQLPPDIQLPPPQVQAMFMQLMAKSGPDPETSKIMAEMEQHAEDNKLEAFKANLEHRNRENERRHVRILQQFRNESRRSLVVLIASILAAVVGLYLSVTGKSAIGIPLLVYAGILIKDLAGKQGASVDVD
jgi:hypothetical protein